MRHLGNCVRHVLVLALCGSVTGQEVLETVEGSRDGDAYGLAVRLAGDVNKDGVSDLIVGAPLTDDRGTHSGSAFVYSGADSKLLYVFRGADAGDELGYAVNGAGDVNQDGYADLIVGAPYDDEKADKIEFQNNGSVQVFSGRDGKLLYTFRGTSNGAALGWSVCGAGDLNRDGHDDVVAGAPFHGRLNAPDTGLLIAYSGKDGKPLYKIRGTAAGDRFGWAIASVDDTDGDKVRDLLVGIEGSAERTGLAGSAQLYSGRTGKRRRTFTTGQEEDYFGTAVADAGDVNGDGRADLIVGGWNGRNGDGVATGTAMVFSGKNGKVLLQVFGKSKHDRFGAAVAGIGDVDGDGLPDIAIGAPGEKDINAGYVSVFSGKTGKVVFSILGEGIGDGFGTSICALGDRDKDGRPDLIVGAPGLRKRGGWQAVATSAGR